MVTVGPLSKIIALSCVLALGFILIILSCALFDNWLPLTVVVMFVLAPAPDAICSRCAPSDDFMSESTAQSTIVDFGRFFTGFLFFSGLALPAVFAHNDMIGMPAMLLSLSGGLIVYITMMTFSSFFHEAAEEF